MLQTSEENNLYLLLILLFRRIVELNVSIVFIINVLNTNFVGNIVIFCSFILVCDISNFFVAIFFVGGTRFNASPARRRLTTEESWRSGLRSRSRP